MFRAPASSLECCCFVNNEEFLSGSDDGSIELWTLMRKKPIYIMRNAHALLTESMKSDQNDSGRIPNGNLGKPISSMILHYLLVKILSMREQRTFIFFHWLKYFNFYNMNV